MIVASAQAGRIEKFALDFGRRHGIANQATTAMIRARVATTMIAHSVTQSANGTRFRRCMFGQIKRGGISYHTEDLPSEPGRPRHYIVNVARTIPGGPKDIAVPVAAVKFAPQESLSCLLFDPTTITWVQDTAR
jgi:hypothetical protein